ncbi:copper chaperone PCu(A)C [Thiosulfativibrio zosterae]|uniref:Transporter n=1 Tax=Thiosulfativibrio zosterae TaxID=2675053 RepID=A0A6F8PMT8_9GAMM|nr:copper chaperone PCu(A)C [Thiosulfativibrio zosterae]BBP43422.1 hypothetical protein THMIRHAT_11680 [Thiosulfativibrio zosterae]
MLNKTLLKMALIGLTSVSSFSAMANEAANILIENPFAREVPPTAMASASFMTLKNNSDQDIKLVSANSTVAKKVELHEHTHDNGVMKMRQIPNIVIPAHGETALQPGGLHIMLINLNQGIKAGDQVKVDLTFEDGSQKTVEMPVKSLMGMGGMKMHMQH